MLERWSRVSPAANAGLMTGDRILEINGETVTSWDNVDSFINDNPGKTLSLRVKRDGKVIDLSITSVRKSGKSIFGENKELWDIGISPLIYPVVGEVMKGGRAQDAGIKKGDMVLTIDDKAIKTWEDMTAIIHNNPGNPLRFQIKRDDHVMNIDNYSC